MIVVFGSVNADLVTRVAALPRPGETVAGPRYEIFGGGKGANQAYAAARAGAKVAFLGAVGHDAFADVALADLVAVGVDLSHVVRTASPTGAAFIGVDPAGENIIMVASGANADLGADALHALALSEHDILLLQGEIAADASLAAAARAKACGARVVVNAAPVQGFDTAALPTVDVLIVNEAEALAVAQRLHLSETDPENIARIIDARGTACVVTLGARGVVGWWSGVRRSVPAFRVDVVDTVGAGDAFCGAFAAALSRGYGFTGALARGAAAGALACTAAGARAGVPDVAAIENLASVFQA